MKIQIEQLDLLGPWPAIALRDGYYAVRVLVRAGVIPIGDVFLRPARGRLVSHDRLRRRIARRLAPRILKTFPGDGVDIDAILLPTGAPDAIREAFQEIHGNADSPTPGVTVAVVTRGRADLLAACVCTLKQLDYREFEILIVDGGDDPAPSRDLADTLGVGYVRSLIHGPAGRARNAAVERAGHEWVAFIDDDCRPERAWLRELVRPTRASTCRCVCGLVQPARLESAADIAFEMHRGLAQPFSEITLTPNAIDASATRP